MTRDVTPTVLLVESGHDDRATYPEYLRSAGFRTIEIDNAADAFSLAGTADVIVTDVRVAGAFDGIELVRRLRADPQNQEKPIIVLTASTVGLDRHRAYSAGCDGFLAKPCLPETLVIRIRYELAVRSAPRPRRLKRATRSHSQRLV